LILELDLISIIETLVYWMVQTILRCFPDGRGARPIALGLLLIALAETLSAGTISTLGAWVPPFGISTSSGAIGQTFLAPSSDSVLNSVTFEINNPLSQAVSLTAYVYAFQYTDYIDGGHFTGDTQGTVVGPAIFTSGVLSIAPSASSDSFAALIIPTGAALLTPGQEYIAFLDTTRGSLPNVVVGSSFGPGGSLLYAGGEEVLGGPFDPAQSEPTIFTDENTDLAFALQFGSPVPEPGTVSFVGCAAGACLLLSIRRGTRRGRNVRNAIRTP
jgi:hypothetical protein